jgi:prephenate dehydrogenase
VGVVGLGVMGGSLVRGLSSAGRAVLAWSPDTAEREEAAALPGVTVAEPGGMAGCRGVVVAVHLDALGDALQKVAAGGEGAGWVQDVASLQAPALRALGRAGLGSRAISSHPMAGAEGSGFGASRADLYSGARVWLTPSAAAGDVRDDARAFWEEVGARPAWIEAEEHDRRMGWVSHLPQLVSTELAALLMARGLAPADLGPGALDMTRLAASAPGMWEPLLRASPRVAAEALEALAERLAHRARSLADGDISAFGETLAETREWRLEG